MYGCLSCNVHARPGAFGDVTRFIPMPENAQQMPRGHSSCKHVLSSDASGIVCASALEMRRFVVNTSVLRMPTSSRLRSMLATMAEASFPILTAIDPVVGPAITMTRSRVEEARAASMMSRLDPTCGGPGEGT
eukprot:scaffold153562_cov39-Tisochrysis_lutea.AAC.1